MTEHAAVDPIGIVAADGVPGRSVWRAFVEGFRGYVVPVELSEEQFAGLLVLGGIDLAASRIALDRHGEPVGIALVGIRGREAWCGGLGVVPAARRGGLGRRLMEGIATEAAARGARRLRLEVIDGNDAARALYERLGYRPRRRLDVFSGEPSIAERPHGPVAPLADRETVWAAFADYHPIVPAWQRDLPSLRHLAATSPAAPVGLCLGDPARPDAYLLAGARGTGVAVLDNGWRRDLPDPVAAFDRLVGHLIAANPGRAITAHNVAADDPLDAALRRHNVAVALTQTEMALDLG